MDVTKTREAMGLSRANLATMIGVHRATIYRIESGDMDLTERTRKAIELLAKAKRVKVVL